MPRSISSKFSRRALALESEDSSAWDIQDRAAARACAGEDILFLTVGDPDQPTPTSIAEFAIGAIRGGRTHYSPLAGEPRLRAAVARALTDETRRKTSSDHVVVFPGAQNALFCAALMLIDSGDEVIVAEPYYATYPGVLASVGACMVPAPADTSKGFAFDVDTILSRVTPRTKAILFSNPNNPTGATMTAEDLRTLASMCRQHGIWLIADEVYSNLVYDRPHVSAWGECDPDWTLVINSMSKSYAMTGWRLGWAAAPPELAAHLTRLAAASQFACTQFIQDAAADALGRVCPERDELREEYRRRRDFVVRRVDAMSDLRVIAPDGGMFVMIDVRGVSLDDVAFAHALLDEERVAVIPGSGFGASSRGYVRVSLTRPLDMLERGLQGMSRFAERVRRGEITLPPPK